jgi:hypothetical protein
VLERPPDTRRAAARQRQKRHRARQHNGLAVYPVTVSAETIDMLCRLGWLRDCDAGDPQRVSAAISALLADSARHETLRHA